MLNKNYVRHDSFFNVQKSCIIQRLVMQILHLCLVGFVKDCSYNEQSEVYVF